MKSIKILWLLTLITCIGILSACDFSKDDSFEVTLSANYIEIEPTVTESYSNKGGQMFTFTAPVVDGYIFEYWHIVDSNDVMSLENTFNYTPYIDIAIEAVYSISFEIDEIETNPELLLLDLIPYYDDAEGLYGEDLKSALHTIINTRFEGVTYGEARYILDESDQDPNNPGNIILVYLGASISGVWDSGATWNREHVWPQSKLGASANNSVVNRASDLYNLMPSNTQENSNRGNSPYSSIKAGYEPRDEVKGDVARALFYMIIMYEDLELVNTYPNQYEMAYLDELLAWHYGDPVDDFELNRLEVIFGEQLNRNPFVDYPHFVDLIWFHEELPVS